jgi:hypothetical protein
MSLHCYSSALQCSASRISLILQLHLSIGLSKPPSPYSIGAEVHIQSKRDICRSKPSRPFFLLGLHFPNYITQCRGSITHFQYTSRSEPTQALIPPCDPDQDSRSNPHIRSLRNRADTPKCPKLGSTYNPSYPQQPGCVYLPLQVFSIRGSSLASYAAPSLIRHYDVSRFKSSQRA